jgi:hypothetical protein
LILIDWLDAQSTSRRQPNDDQIRFVAALRHTQSVDGTIVAAVRSTVSVDLLTNSIESSNVDTFDELEPELDASSCTDFSCVRADRFVSAYPDLTSSFKQKKHELNHSKVHIFNCEDGEQMKLKRCSFPLYF